MKYTTQYILKTIVSLFILSGIMAATVALAHASFVSENTVLTVIQK